MRNHIGKTCQYRSAVCPIKKLVNKFKYIGIYLTNEVIKSASSVTKANRILDLIKRTAGC